MRLAHHSNNSNLAEAENACKGNSELIKVKVPPLSWQQITILQKNKMKHYKSQSEMGEI